MSDEIEILKKRFSELYEKSDRSAYFTFTDFLGLSEQSVLSELTSRFNRGAVKLFGGACGAERVMARFGDPEEIGYDAPYPILCLKIEPRSAKFADRLTHRDFLGALMQLGVDRSKFGDIVVRDNSAYLFVKEELAEFITGELLKVKRTDVSVKIASEIPEGELYKTERRQIQVQSERVDAVIAKAYSLSREDAQNLIKRSLVFVNGREINSVSHTPKANDKISVRGYGRFVYLGFASTSRKGKLNALIELYV